MRVFQYDGTFDGLLSAVFDAYAGRRFPDALRSGVYAPALLATETYCVRTSRDKARRVEAALAKKLSVRARQDLRHAWLWEEAGADLRVFRYIRAVVDAPPGIETRFTDPAVLAVTQLARKVRGEIHHHLGFLRFAETTEQVYLAAIAPRCDILPFLLPHFADRFADQPWIIYDETRGYGVYFDTRTFHDVSLDRDALQDGRPAPSLLTPEERLFQLAWKSYCTAASIPERRNPRLQARCLPRRFWPRLPELEGPPDPA